MHLIKRCLNCGRAFATNKTNTTIFCSVECETQFKKKIPFYSYSLKERELILKIKNRSY